ncbi:uncharacterized protein LOC144634250 isoform X1 [Oculina patagonica]
MAFKISRITMLLCIVTWITNNAEGSPTGVKINDIKYCGPQDKTWKLKIIPLPVITSGTRFNFTITFTPAVDIIAVSSSLELKSVVDGAVIRSYNDNACPSFPKMCNLPANETQTLTYSKSFPYVPPFFKESYVVTFKLYNQEMVLWFCLEFSIEVF